MTDTSPTSRPRSLSPTKFKPVSPKRSPKRSPSPRRSRSPRRSKKSSRTSSRSRSYRSRSYSPQRSYSRSPARRRKHFEREPAPPSKVIGIFGLSSVTKEDDIRREFEKYGGLEDAIIIYDRRTGESKRFGFVYFVKLEDAIKAKNETNGMVLDGNQVRIDFSLTKRAYSPTPGRYMGRATCVTFFFFLFFDLLFPF
eukprot:TRINITY_DN199_c0_g1_i2.p2 TRINITY_DN199_c0_g1~~TRINITY_DN199_c0_g1_i2.p2  ORF type:complete len:197 (+),score=29.99 TRINITY_DN199_c0_g1_i2:74-664(+)